ncbi:hypothetical protein TNCV_1619361 [Trichonephila clavipes]|nr:hypothetical protein TNCV_1619361 [Trichonephila clavipes]
MAAPLSICTKKERRALIRVLFAEGVKPAEIIRRMQAQYGDRGFQDYWDKLYGDLGNITKIQICIATHDRKHLRSMLDGVVHKSIGRNRSALSQSFKLLSPANKYGMAYEHLACRYAPDLWIGRWKCTTSRKIASQNVPTKKCTGQQDVD